MQRHTDSAGEAGPWRDLPGSAPYATGTGLEHAAFTKTELTAENHMEIIRNDQYSVLPYGDTQHTYTWLQRVRTGQTAVARLYADELKDHVPGFGDGVRVLEEQGTLTAEEHMQVIRACEYALVPGEATRQTHRWFQDVRDGALPVARAYAEELRARVSGFGDGVRVLEEQRTLTAEEHMQVIRACGYAPVRGGTTQQTYRWFQDVRNGVLPVARAYAEELRARVSGFGDGVRVLEEQRTLTAEEHMQVIRACGYALVRGGTTQQTYEWLCNVRTGVSPASRAYIEELAHHTDGFGDAARPLEEQRILTAEEHMQVIRACGYALVRGGTTQQTYKWFHNVTNGRSQISQVYLQEIEEAQGKRIPRAKVIEEKRSLNQADHMKILRSRSFRVSPRGTTERTYAWLAKALAGEVKNLRATYAAEIAAATVENAGTR